MNTLSWLIYAAEAFSSLKAISLVVAVLSLIVGVILTGVGIFASGIGAADDDNEARRFAAVFSPIGKRFLTLAAVAGLVWVASPTSQTLYLIAASEAGETVVTSPDAIEMMDGLKAIIKKRLREELGGSDE